jgi:hypothetical protein
MLKETFLEFYERDLQKLTEEINAYENEQVLWMTKEGINNSAGNLCLHLIGNLKHFIGATLGNTGYIRERDKEFSLKNIPKSDLISSVHETKSIVLKTLQKLSAEDLEKDFPLEKHNKIVTTENMLMHLLIHLGYHLGQINYHRRILAQ